MLPLEDFRISLQLGEFHNTGDRLTLKDLFAFLKGQGSGPSLGAHSALSPDRRQSETRFRPWQFHQRFSFLSNDWMEVFLRHSAGELIDSDDDEDHQFGLQPRFLISKRSLAVQTFQNHPGFDSPRLVVSLTGKCCSSMGNTRPRLCSGEGDASLNARFTSTPISGYSIKPNISAHDTFGQTRFFASVMVLKLGGQFGKDFDDYKKRKISDDEK